LGRALLLLKMSLLELIGNNGMNLLGTLLLLQGAVAIWSDGAWTVSRDEGVIRGRIQQSECSVIEYRRNIEHIQLQNLFWVMNVCVDTCKIRYYMVHQVTSSIEIVEFFVKRLTIQPDFSLLQLGKRIVCARIRD